MWINHEWKEGLSIGAREADLLSRCPMRQMAPFCVILAAEKTLKSPLFDSFLARNQ
jgi:hypothetical protein